MKAIITRKIGMTSTIAEDGVVQAVTLLAAEPNVITQLKTAETDGYTAVQMGFETDKKPHKAQVGHYRASKATPKVAREFRVDEITEELKVGEQVNAESFEIGDHVHVTATSKGKGWAGTIKRHNFIEVVKHTVGVVIVVLVYWFNVSSEDFKGKKMAGQMGYEQVTVRNLTVALIDTEHNVIGVTGAVPGPRKGIVLVKGAK